MENYIQEAKEGAIEFAREFSEQIAEQLVDKRQASSDYNNDYPNGDSYFHESFIDKEYDLQEAAELLCQLRDYEETDSGLWEGQDPEKAIATKAAFTFGAAVAGNFRELIEHINAEYEKILDVADEFEFELTEEQAVLAVEHIIKGYES